MSHKRSFYNMLLNLSALLLRSAASGEWEGVTATFTPDGKPLEIPSQYVPSEYGEWGQTIYDWQANLYLWASSEILSPGCRVWKGG